MKFSKFTLALGLGLASSVFAIPHSSAVQIDSSSGISPSSPSGSTSAASGATSNSRSTSNSNTHTSTSTSSDRGSSDSSDSEGEDGSLVLSYYVSPQGNANAMTVNQIPDGQVQAPGSGSSSGSGKSSGVSPLSLAGSENLNTYSYEAGQGSPYANIVSQVPDGQVQAPGSTSGQAPVAYSVLSVPSTSSFGSSEEPSSYSAEGAGSGTPLQQYYSPLDLGAESYDASDYEALQDMYGLSSYSSPGSTSGSTGSYSASSTNAYGEGQSQALTDTTHAVGAVPHEYTATPTPEGDDTLPTSSQGTALVSSEPALYEGSAAGLNVAKVGIVVALFAALMG
ncbi:hypothetical protein L211DRAFT_873073 [Terfezia boudieri ATCC MYA-4762]|uniref:Uncharacterized protein n=1 Tax=Terfezia boudieri ATCC MYA-4762 TaxID=1051890 RepID=A0A3N4M3L5_9PEZI|nr:hypothetical protein L211DRAFT_873073 [Terfezia boudieri ATCC MYA-4762]